VKRKYLLIFVVLINRTFFITFCIIGIHNIRAKSYIYTINKNNIMYEIIKTSHSHLAWLALGAIVLAILIAVLAVVGNKPFGKLEKMTAMFGMIGAHIQLLLGLILYFVSPYGLDNFSGANMKDPLSRLLMLEHPLTNIIAIVMITIGYRKAKAGSTSKPVMIYFTIGLLLLLSRLPWSTWLA
jgi:hypothetical protein